MLTPANNLPLPRGVIRSATRQLEGSLEVRPFYPLGVPHVKENHDGDHKDGPTIGKIRLPTRAAKRCLGRHIEGNSHHGAFFVRS